MPRDLVAQSYRKFIRSPQEEQSASLAALRSRIPKSKNGQFNVGFVRFGQFERSKRGHIRLLW
jgi:hypothetical protein